MGRGILFVGLVGMFFETIHENIFFNNFFLTGVWRCAITVERRWLLEVHLQNIAVLVVVKREFLIYVLDKNSNLTCLFCHSEWMATPGFTFLK